MPLPSPYTIPIPQTNILDYVFPPNAPVSDNPLWIDADEPSHSLSPKEALLWIQRLGQRLKELGIRKGDVVLMVSKNHVFVPVLYLGVMGYGAVFSACNPAYGVDEMSYQITNTTCKLILVEPALLPTVLSAASKTNFPTSSIYLFTDKPSTTPQNPNIKDFLTTLPPPTATPWTWPSLTPKQSTTTIAALNYSSGTTGLPKGVMITHSNIIANVEQSLYMRNLSQPPSSSSSSPSQQSTSPHPSTPSQERWLGFLPLYHAYGQLWSIVAALKTATPVYVMRSFSLIPFLHSIQTYKITHIQTAPPVLVMLAKRPETHSYDLSSLRNILCGAAPLSKELQNEVSERFGLNVVQTWGMTELTCSSLHVPGGLDDRTGSVGFLDPNCSIKLLSDSNGTEVGPGERGEIWVKGPNVCAGYWRNETATKEVFDADGYLRTGDVGVRDGDGRFWIVDRKKELIKVKGFQVAPAELEAVLLGHPGVGDCAVVGVTFDHEEHPLAYIARKPGVQLTEQEVVAWMAQRVAKHKQLTGGVIFINEVPKSPSGKIQRMVLREWAKRDVEKGLVGRVRARL